LNGIDNSSTLIRDANAIDKDDAEIYNMRSFQGRGEASISDDVRWPWSVVSRHRRLDPNPMDFLSGLPRDTSQWGSVASLLRYCRLQEGARF
jgi:hypothetical protein